MKELLEIAGRRPDVYEQSPGNIWDDEYVSKSMLKAHLDENLDAATRKIGFVRESVKWIGRAYPPKEYPRLLDLGCGPGIYAELFCREGYEVSGIDMSRNSITYAEEAARKNQMRIQYIRGDYTRMKFPSVYDLITLIYCDFGVLPGEVRKELLVKIHDALAPQGVFLFDVFTALKYEGMQETKDWDICENGFWSEGLCLTLRSFCRYDTERTYLNRYVTVREDGLSLYNVWEHTFTLEELRQDLREAGFGEIEVFGNAAGKPYEADGATICIAARKEKWL